MLVFYLFLYPYFLPLISHCLPTALFEPTSNEHRTYTQQTPTTQCLAPPLTSYLLPLNRPFTKHKKPILL
nr:MAG TPA: hypothetical protein [Caudoviricetes sp.]